MGKAALQAQLQAKQGELTALNKEIEELNACKEALSSFSTEIEYVLKDHQTIKDNYHLAGTPYLNETTNEENILKTTTQVFSNKKNDTIVKLTLKIAELEAQKPAITASILQLENSIRTTKEA